MLSLDQHLGKRVIGQSHALAGIAERIRTSKASLEDPSKPIGVFLLVGPSGVGKTETALALSDMLYGGERNLITINMSEFQEAHTVSTLKGSPPGYVGYGEGGVLTEAVRRRPYSVVLLDEVEKAHPDVLELFFQVFDKGMMEDGEGREIDFKNTIIILTSNAGTDTLMKLTADPETMPSPEGLVKALKPELNKIFKPAFLGRLQCDKRRWARVARRRRCSVGQRGRNLGVNALGLWGELKRRAVTYRAVLRGQCVVRARRSICIYDPFREQIGNGLPVSRFVGGVNVVEAAVFADDDDHVLDRRCGLSIVAAIIGLRA